MNGLPVGGLNDSIRDSLEQAGGIVAPKWPLWETTQKRKSLGDKVLRKILCRCPQVQSMNFKICSG